MKFEFNNFLFFIKNFFSKLNNKLIFKKIIFLPIFIIGSILVISLVNSSKFENNKNGSYIKDDDLDLEFDLKLKYFTELIGDENIAKLTLNYSIEKDVKPELVIAIMKVESKFNPYAKNHNSNGSIDRGLLQLNNKTFSDLTSDEFYEPEINIKKGVEFINWCLKKSDNNLIKALAYYNAGFGKVSNKNVGEATLDYINKVLTHLQNIESSFIQFKSENL